MKKKNIYMSPDTEVFEMQASAILSGSVNSENVNIPYGGIDDGSNIPSSRHYDYGDGDDWDF